MNQNIVKGLLILTVIIDHNEFSRSLFPGFLLGMSFHVAAFMTMPFLRPALPLGNRASWEYVFRLYFPFLWITLGMALLVTFLSGAPLAARLERTILTLYSGNFWILKETTQMGLLWFLPSFISLILLRAVIEAGNSAWKLAMLLLATAVHGLLGPLAAAWQDYLPLGVLPALYMVPIAYLTIWLQQKWLVAMPRGLALAAALLAFGAIKIVQVQWHLENEIGAMTVASFSQWPALLVNDLEALCGTLVLFQAGRWPVSRWLESCGQFSLQIYMFHAFVALVLYKITLRLLPAPAPAPAFLLTVGLTAGLTLFLSRRLMRSRLAPLLFPRSPASLLADLGVKTAPRKPV